MTSHLAMLIAATSNATQVDVPSWSSLVQFGLLGLLFLDIVGTHKFIVPRWALDALSVERDRRENVLQATITRLEAELHEAKVINAQLGDVARDKLIPALTLATDMQKTVLEMAARRGRPDG